MEFLFLSLLFAIMKHMNDSNAYKKIIFESYLANELLVEWSFVSLGTAAQEAGLDSSLPKILFKGDLEEAIFDFNHFVDTMLLGSFDLQHLSALRTHEKVQQALEKKMLFFNAYAHKTVSILRYFSSPLRLKTLIQLQWRTLNRIWYFAGDTATDFNYYSKRVLLGYIYKTTFLYWLKNRHAPIKNTIDFMNKRFKEVAMVPHLRGIALGMIKKLNPFR
jgi:ubiquinone biosynthesis protein COQ9